jgi:twitching motility protein PilT
LFRIARQLVPANDQPLTSKQSERLSLELLSDRQREMFREKLDYDFMSIDEHGRYRVNVGYFDGDVGTIIRILAQKPKSFEELRLPEVVRQLAYATKGLVLLTGSASQGKTTTMTALIDEINTHFARHIITIEDPIEYLHTNKKGLVRQRQAGRDTADFHSGLRAALRQNPDVISIGEMRDYETIKIALTAAETGCLVISTLHIISIDKIIERLLSFAPSEDEGHIRYVLADTLVGVIHQELLPTVDGGKRVACEVLIVNQATKHIIRNRGAFFLRNVITTGKKFGMVPMSVSIQNLLDEGTISAETANDVMVNYK